MAGASRVFQLLQWFVESTVIRNNGTTTRNKMCQVREMLHDPECDENHGCQVGTALLALRISLLVCAQGKWALRPQLGKVRCE